jgi:hypothetical protein
MFVFVHLRINHPQFGRFSLLIELEKDTTPVAPATGTGTGGEGLRRLVDVPQTQRWRGL